jgi:hypothetical protein
LFDFPRPFINILAISTGYIPLDSSYCDYTVFLINGFNRDQSAPLVMKLIARMNPHDGRELGD